jgi:quercetin dioxygenase-like cupin family protein
MKKLVISAVLVAAGMAVAAAQTTTPPFQNRRYFTMPLEKDPTREVGLQSVTMPPGAGNQFHRHPGEQWTAVQEGEITFHRQGAAAESGQGRRLELCSARDHPADPLHT